jgi:hypothetical protein
MIDITHAFCNNAPLIRELHKHAHSVSHRQQSPGDGDLKDTEESTGWREGRHAVSWKRLSETIKESCSTSIAGIPMLWKLCQPDWADFSVQSVVHGVK